MVSVALVNEYSVSPYRFNAISHDHTIFRIIKIDPVVPVAVDVTSLDPGTGD
ncbi:unnamed protein product [marine sediment metagenome]|uniref:Uncharacterized protein n=1 Tax=marine sediment metagenome TaxID=412755 RepID=X1KGW5_9ZZZZ